MQGAFATAEAPSFHPCPGTHNGRFCARAFVRCAVMRLLLVLEVAMSEKKEVLMYKGRPLMRKDNLIYYGSMADEFIVMLQVLETKNVEDLALATKVSVQLQRTDPNAKARDRIVKKSEKDGFYTALDVGSVWLARALNTK